MLGKDGKQLKDKKGNPVSKSVPGHWDANSANAFSNAAGLTHFLRGTWLDISLKPSYFIHDKCVAEGWVKQEASGPKKTLKWVFVLANGKTTQTPHAASFGDETSRPAWQSDWIRLGRSTLPPIAAPKIWRY